MKKVIVTKSGLVHYMEGVSQFNVTIETTEDPNKEEVDFSSLSEEDWENFKKNPTKKKVEELKKKLIR